MARVKSRASGQVGFNMTPMIDCLFQLLLFLMVTRHFIEMRTVPVELPPATKAEKKTEELRKYTPVVINVVPPAKNDPKKITRVWMDGLVVVESVEGGAVPNWQPLIDRLKFKLKTTRKERPVNVILRAGKDVPYETIGSVMLCTSKAGIQYWWIQAYRVGNGAADAQNRLDVGAIATGG
jgi:biopolymer transport protein ExbD